MASTESSNPLRRQISVLGAKSLLIGVFVAGLSACGTQDVARAPVMDQVMASVGGNPRIEAKAAENPVIDARPLDDTRVTKNLVTVEGEEANVLASSNLHQGSSKADPLSGSYKTRYASRENISRRRIDGAHSRSDMPRRIGRREATKGIFGFDEVRLGKSEVFHKWSDALQRHTTSRVSNTLLCAKGVLSLCRSEDMVSDFDASLLNLRQSVQHLPAVNHRVNQVSYVEDWANYRERDYWAAPGEFFGNGGDCEDYAIAKYLLLRELGIDPDAMRIVVVMDQYRDTAHAVLAIYVGNDILVLDNLSGAIEPHELVDKYVPVYSLNENHAWLHTRSRNEIGLR